MSELEFDKDRKGWILTTDIIFHSCENCFGDLGLPFFYCNQFGKAFCRKCELELPKRLCMSVAKEHPHLNIIELNKHGGKK